MSQEQVLHDTFTLERDYPVHPKKVFEAFADVNVKAKWWGFDPDDENHTIDFRVGGRELSRGGPPGGPVFTFDATYHDIVQDERMIYSYRMLMDDRPISVSLTTVEIAEHGDGTRLRLTEHGAYFDPADGPEIRSGGTGELLDNLGRVLAGTGR